MKTTNDGDKKMDLIREALEKLSKGHVTTMWGIVVLRRGDTYVYGESINIRDTGRNLECAVNGIYQLTQEIATA